MMERRKFKRRKPAEGEVRNSILDNIEPGNSLPPADRARRVFARAKSDAADMVNEAAQTPAEILRRASTKVEDTQPRKVQVKPVSAAKDGAATRARIEELRREKARLIAEREERARAKEAAHQKAQARKAEIQRQTAVARKAAEAEAQVAEEARIEAELEREIAMERAAAAAPVAAAAPLVLGAAERMEDPVRKPSNARHQDVTDEDWDDAEDAEYDDDDGYDDDIDLDNPDAPADAEIFDDDLTESEPVEPARTRRPAAPQIQRTTTDPDAIWHHLPTFAVDASHLEQNRIITAAREDLAHTAFDVLRTRLLQALRQNGWSRIAITSPSKDCGKTFSAANLALSMARQDDLRTILLDFDMRRPSLANVFGVKDSGRLGDMLRGKISPEQHLRTMGQNALDLGHNLAIGFNDRVEPYASELLGDKMTAEVLDDMEQRFNADVILFDMPPALYHDDVIAARQLFDGVLLVVGGGITKAGEIKDVERRLGAETPLLGTVLNFSEGPGITRYSY